jgi:hypothetical protein
MAGCDAATPTGRRSPQRGKGRKMGPLDIPRHTCDREVAYTRMVAGSGPWIKPKKITFYRCKTCGVSMGSKEEKL